MSVQTIWVADHIALSTCPHNHIYYQIIYCKDGVGEIEVDGVSYKTSPRTAFLVSPMVDHNIIQIDGLHISEVKFTVTDEDMDRKLKTLEPSFVIEERSPLEAALDAVIEEGLYQSVYRKEAADAALTLFLLRLLRSRAVSFEGKSRVLDPEFCLKNSNAAEAQRDADFLKVVDYIEDHLSEQITLDDLTKLVHFDKSYLIVRFKEKWGVPPIKYVNWLRIERAKILLAVTNKTITEIAEEMGFRSVHYFSRFFKEKEKLSPNEYRLLKQKSR